MRTPIRLPGRTRLASRLLAAMLAASVASPVASVALATAATGNSTASARPAAHVVSRASAQAPAAPLRTARTAVRPDSVLTSSACTLAATTYTCDLYAKAGTLTLPDATTVPIWGYAAASADPAGQPGPTLIATAGNDLTINLHNVDLPSATSLAISQLPAIPDQAGVTAGNSKSYTIAAANLAPGTYLYEAGLTADGPRQVAMGLFGALIVRPASCGVAANCAYDASSAFDDEGLVVLSEVDPAFNATPLTFDLSYFAPRYWLIDGKGYPNTAPIATDAGHNLLVRYLNAGLVQHSMTVLGLHERLVAADGKAATNPDTVVADTIPAGSTVDAIASISPAAVAGTQYAVFEAAMHLDNAGILVTPGAPNPANTPISFGGMLTFISVTTGGTGAAGGPVTTAVAVSPSPNNGTTAATLSGTITSAASTVDAAEYFVDSIGADGTGCAITTGLGGATASVSATIPTSGASAPCVDLATLASGNHTFYVHGHDASGWGDAASAVLNLDKTGPAVSGISLTPSRTNGTVSVALQATGSDTATGGQNVTAAEYFIDPVGTPAPGTGTPISIATPATDASLAATIAAATVAGLPDGAHTIAIRAQDAAGNWGALGSATLTVDKTGPNTAGVTATPNPTNGLFGVQIGSAGQLYERIVASIADPVTGGVNSNIVAAEYFIDTVGPNGTGGGMLASSGALGTSPTASVTGAAELFAIAALSTGSHTIYVHGKDAAGNWGPTSTTTLVVDRTRPFITSAGLAPNPTRGATTVTLTVTAIDSANINRIEYFIGAVDPGQGLATAIMTTTPALPTPNPTGTATINIASLPLGTSTVSVRARNVTGNWSALTTLTLTVSPLFADGFDSGNFSAWSTRGGTLSRTTVQAAAAQAGGFGMQAQILSGTSGFVQDNTPLAETRYNARFYVNPNNVTLTNLTPYTIFTALNNVNSSRFSVLLRKNGTQYQVAASLTRNGGTTTSSFFNVSAAAFTAIEVDWSRVGNNLSLSLYLGGVLQGAPITGVSTTGTQGQYRIDTVRMGPQGTLTGASGNVYFDSFVSTRTTPVIGP